MNDLKDGGATLKSDEWISSLRDRNHIAACNMLSEQLLIWLDGR